MIGAQLKVINFYGGAGVGKSTHAAGLFYHMKSQGYNVELINEYAKQMVWEGHSEVMRDQFYLAANQHRQMIRLDGKVDYCITDSPMLLNIVYRDMYGEPLYSNALDALVLECHNRYENINIFMGRPARSKFKQEGRLQDYIQSCTVDERIELLLTKQREHYIKVNYEWSNSIFTELLDYINNWPRE